MRRSLDRTPPPHYQLDIDFPTAVGAAAEATPTMHHSLLPVSIRLALRVADGQTAEFRVVAAFVFLPGLEIPAAVAYGHIVELDATQAGMALHIIPITAQRFILLMALALAALVLTRFRLVISGWALLAMMAWAFFSTRMMLRAIDQMLRMTFGPASPFKRG